MEEVTIFDWIVHIHEMVMRAKREEAKWDQMRLVLGKKQKAIVETYLMALYGAKKSTGKVEDAILGLPVLLVDKDDYLAVVKEVTA